MGPANTIVYFISRAQPYYCILHLQEPPTSIDITYGAPRPTQYYLILYLLGPLNNIGITFTRPTQ